MSPSYFGEYEILGELGRDCTGLLYKARRPELDRLVTLKLMAADVQNAQLVTARLQREAEALASVHHRNVVAIYEVGECDGCPYIVLEYVEGGTLADRLDGTPWPTGKAAALVETLARAAHAVHQSGYVHRDIKPAHVLLTRDGEPKLTGFGLVRSREGAATGAIIGTPLYMPPEQATGQGDRTGPPSDVYALGGLLYELLTGRPPFQAASVAELLRKTVGEEPQPPRTVNPGVPPDLEAVCLKCLAKDPGRRYATAEALADDLRRVAGLA